MLSEGKSRRAVTPAVAPMYEAKVVARAAVEAVGPAATAQRVGAGASDQAIAGGVTIRVSEPLPPIAFSINERGSLWY